ncbi:MAG TPA: hypothetical protein P5026_07340 [Kiritimatiellia bacterium]|nr:hypothetical protein [Kiritimatiellia bacterium]
MNTAAIRHHGRQRFGCHACFAAGMVVALAGFVLLWSPWQWLMLAGAVTSCSGVGLSVAAAWRKKTSVTGR